MRIHRILQALTIVLCAASPIGTAWAATIIAVQQPQPIPNDVEAANVLSGNLSGAGSLSQIPGTGTARSPWTTRTGPAQAPEEDREFLYAQNGGITFDLLREENGGSAATGLTLLWGSPDSYNFLKLLRDGVVVEIIVPGGDVPVDPLHTYAVTIRDVSFDTVLFYSTQASFEFANLRVDQFADELDCEESLEAAGGSLRRLFDVGSSSCDSAVTLPADFEFDGTTVVFRADYGVLSGVEPAFEVSLGWRAEWVVPPSPSAIPYITGAGNPPMATQTLSLSTPLSVQWFGESATPPEDETYFLDVCPGSPALDGEGVLIGFNFPEGFVVEDGWNDMSPADGFQFGCLTERRVLAVEDESQCTDPRPDPGAVCVSLVEKVYLRGDWTATRTLR